MLLQAQKTMISTWHKKPTVFQTRLVWKKKPRANTWLLRLAPSSLVISSLKTLENLGRELGYQLPSGAGTASDKVASKILQPMA